MQVDLNSNTLNKQIITYLGNKRKLIGFIDDAVSDIIANDEELSKKENKDITFFDIFSGSGVVSRYGKLKGFKTFSNDLEEYSEVINRSMLKYDEKVAEEAFRQVAHNNAIEYLNDAYQAVLNYLNALEQPELEESFYFAKHYAPKETSNPDFDNERLFYTQENARKIDAIVEKVFDTSLFNEVAKDIVLSSLMYNMTIHINTSGTMKGFHNGWGGKGKAALERILSPIVLEKLPFVDNTTENRVFCDYAEKVFTNNDLDTVDIIYADPPYNQHQYSANYNHLTTVVRNDKYEPGEVVQGSRAGIRTDHTRSDFCKSTRSGEKKLAEVAFNDFIQGVKARYIVMSYNNEGVVDMNTLLDIISQECKNTIEVKYRVYDKYKGGKATTTSTKVVEYLLVIKMDKAQSEEDFKEVKRELLINTQKNLFSDRYINYTSLNHRIEGNDAFILDDSGNVILSIDKETYRVKDDYLDHHDDIEIIKFVLDYELTRVELVEQYILDGNIKLAEKALTSFTSKKMKDVRLELEEKIRNL